jgi:hypothetical protein
MRFGRSRDGGHVRAQAQVQPETLRVFHHPSGCRAEEVGRLRSAHAIGHRGRRSTFTQGHQYSIQAHGVQSECIRQES